MSQERIAIICNGVVPGSNVPGGAQGLRARGLQRGLQALGYEVDIVTMANIVHSQMERWDSPNVRIPGYWRLLQPQPAPKVINRSYGTVIMPNWAVFPQFRPRHDTQLIYDFFSATQVEHSFITDAETLRERRETKLEVLRHASGFIGNGVGRAEYGANFLRENGLGDHDVVSVRLTAEGLPRSVAGDGPFRIFAGGFDQPWTQGVTPEILAQIAACTGAEIVTIGLGRNLHLDSNAAALAALARNQHGPGRVLGYPPAPSQVYNRLNASCYVALDVFKYNAERAVSYSTRAVNALSNNCPVITMSFTEIGQIVKELKCGWVLDELSEDALIALLREIESDRDEINRRAANTRLFQEQYGDPVTEARGLAELLT